MSTQAHALHRKHKNGISHTPLTSGVIKGAESILADAAELGEEKLEGVRSTLTADLETARRRLEKLESTLKHRAKAVDDYVHESPWPAIGCRRSGGRRRGRPRISKVTNEHGLAAPSRHSRFAGRSP